MLKIFGRQEETETLMTILQSKQPEFLALYGRRRIGKTYLIRQAFAKKNVIFFNATGMQGGSRRQQLSHFIDKLSEVFYHGAPLVVSENWSDAFKLLTKALKEQPKNRKIILFFDELPWMATKKSRLLETLEYYWNQYWSNDARIKLIVCGSSASWIIQKIINNKGGLHNRITHKMPLEPFTLLETKQYLESRNIKLKNKQVLLIYMVTGGVPYYLSHVEKGLSAAQIVEKLAFTKKGILFEEFDNLFSSLFEHSDEYIKIIRAVSSARYGISQSELLNVLGPSAIGSVGLKRLQELEETGFIMSFMPYHHKRQGIYYRLVDEYSLFYLRWIEPIKTQVQRKDLGQDNWIAIQNSPAWNSWAGLAFESICYKHISMIRKALRIGPGAVADSWRYVPKKGEKEQGAQIDLLFDRQDDVITLCEIKYSDDAFVLTKEYTESLRRKMRVFKERTHTKKELFLSMIASSGLKNNFYADELISGIATLDDLFNNN